METGCRRINNECWFVDDWNRTFAVSVCIGDNNRFNCDSEKLKKEDNGKDGKEILMEKKF